MMLAVDKEIVESVRPPRAALYQGEYGSVSGLPKFPEHQRRILDEALRLIEPMDQAGTSPERRDGSAVERLAANDSKSGRGFTRINADENKQSVPRV